MNCGCRSLFLLSVAWLAQPAARADEPALLERVGPATLRTRNSVANGALVLAFTDLVHLVVEIEGDAGLDVQTPQPWTKGPWQARLAAASERKETGQKTVWTQALELEPLQPGDLTLVLEPLRYRNDGGEWQTATWKAIAAHVTSRLTQPDLKNARDITAIEELPATPPRNNRIGLILPGLAAAALLAMLLVGRLWRHRARRARSSPESWAQYELQRLQALKLPERGKHERFGTLLTGLLRRYLEKRFELPARRQTTGEFLATLAGHAELAPQREFLESFLRRCDLLKFAPISASVAECHALGEQVGQFICQPKAPAIPEPKGAT